jgi:hypothetical protein
MSKELIEKAFILALTGEDYFEDESEALEAGVALLKKPEQYVRFALGILEGKIYDLVDAQKVIIKTVIDVIMGKYPSKNLIINCPPALGKSSMVIWGLGSYLYSLDGTVKNLHISRFDDLVLDNSNKIRSILTSDAHKRLFDINISKSTSAKGLW